MRSQELAVGLSLCYNGLLSSSSKRLIIILITHFMLKNCFEGSLQNTTNCGHFSFFYFCTWYKVQYSKNKVYKRLLCLTVILF